MKKKANNEPTKEQIQNMKYSEERFQLLDTIREMVSDEFERRKLIEKGYPYLENPFPISIEPQPPPKMQPRYPTWQRLAKLFNADCHSHNKEDKPLDKPDKTTITPEPPTRRCSERSSNREAT